MRVGGEEPDVGCAETPQAIPAGSTLSLAGSIVLPAGTWSGQVHVLDLRDPTHGGTQHSSAGTVTMVKGSATSTATYQ